MSAVVRDRRVAEPPLDDLERDAGLAHEVAGAVAQAVGSEAFEPGALQCGVVDPAAEVRGPDGPAAGRLQQELCWFVTAGAGAVGSELVDHPLRGRDRAAGGGRLAWALDERALDLVHGFGDRDRASQEVDVADAEPEDLGLA